MFKLQHLIDNQRLLIGTGNLIVFLTNGPCETTASLIGSLL